ncbi:MAG: Pr6Pr family membrane protein [Pelagibacterium sp.]|uniref:Pr6Pr family membrane protein n=1 Tax=Pelagibacterium sp. TaxID=1967288 RepID=UPI0032EB30D9
MNKALAWAGLAIGGVALVTQFAISMQLYLANGRDVFGALGTFFSYYTILTNIVLVLIYLSDILDTKNLALFRLPITRAMMVANMALVSLFVYFVLRHLTVLERLFFYCDLALHYAAPVLYAIFWFTGPHGALRWTMLPAMLAPTFIYFLYAMARGLWVREYPYPILNAVELGYGQVLINAVLMTLGLSILTALVIFIDFRLARRWQPAH